MRLNIVQMHRTKMSEDARKYTGIKLISIAKLSFLFLYFFCTSYLYSFSHVFHVYIQRRLRYIFFHFHFWYVQRKIFYGDSGAIINFITMFFNSFFFFRWQIANQLFSMNFYQWIVQLIPSKLIIRHIQGNISKFYFTFVMHKKWNICYMRSIEWLLV